MVMVAFSKNEYPHRNGGNIYGKETMAYFFSAPQDANYILANDDDSETALMTLNNAGHPITNKLYCRNQIFLTEADGHAG